MELIMKLGLLAGGLALVIVPRSFIEKLQTYRPTNDSSEPVIDRSIAGPRLVGVACVVLALLSLVL
jgi:hypothetical protein